MFQHCNIGVLSEWRKYDCPKLPYFISNAMQKSCIIYFFILFVQNCLEIFIIYS